MPFRRQDVQVPACSFGDWDIDDDVWLPVLSGNSWDMADYPTTRCSQVTAYEGMDWFAVTAAAWQQAEATVADDERVAEVRVGRSSPLHGQLGSAYRYAYEYVVESRV